MILKYYDGVRQATQSHTFNRRTHTYDTRCRILVSAMEKDLRVDVRNPGHSDKS